MNIPDSWTPTAENINAPSLPLREYIMNAHLRKECERLSEGTVIREP
jgi:hypothetical protein